MNVGSRLSRLRGCLFVSMLGCCEGCSSPNADGQAHQFFAERDRILCSKAFECCTAQDPWVGGIGGVTQCLELSPNGSRAAELARAIESGRAKLDTSALKACLEALRAADCAAVADIARGADPSECQGVRTGSLPAGEACQNDFECVTQNCRLADASDRNSTRRVCGETANTAGASCGPGAGGLTCVPPLVCDLASGPGLACGQPQDEGGICEHDSDCLSQFCSPANGTCSAVCRVPLESGVLTLR